MWALRRASNPLKNRGIGLGSFHAGYARVEVTSSYLEKDVETAEHAKVISDKIIIFKRYHHKQCDSLKCHIGRHHLSSHAGMKSSEDEDEDDLEDGFSELETPVAADEAQASNTPRASDDESVSELELSEEVSDDEVAEPKDELEVSDSAAYGSKKTFKPTRASNQLLMAVMNAPGLSVQKVLDKWVADGNKVNKSDIMAVNLDLRKRRMYGRALQMLEWSADRFECSERDYASRLDLIAKAQGLQKAEQYIEKIPEACRGEIIYRTYLANCVVNQNSRKAEEVFNKMKDMGFPMTAFAYNQLLLLYKRTDKRKVADVLARMEKENVKPTLFTYNILIDIKGQSKEITKMDQIVETMKEEGIEPVNHTRNIMAKHYISAKHTDKAEAVLKEMEGGDALENRDACRFLLYLYGLLGKTDDVSRIWKLCQKNANIYEYLAAIEAWGKLNKVKEAEDVFEKAVIRWKKPSPKLYSTLLKVYADHNMLTEGRDLVKRMANDQYSISPLILDALVRLHVEAGEVEKADTILHKATQLNKTKPMFNSFITIMEQYSKKGDVHNAEKIFHRMRQAGYVARHRQFQVLVQTYINGKAPAYGMKQRMKGDNIFPNITMNEMLVKVDPFEKSAGSDLLD